MNEPIKLPMMGPDKRDPGSFIPSLQDLEYRLVDFLRMLKVRKVMILGTALAVTLATLVAVFTIPPNYTSTATVMLDQRKNNITDLTDVLQGLTNDPTVMPNQVQIISSRELAQRVVEQLKLTDDPEFNGQPVAEGGIAGFVHSLRWLNPKTWMKLIPQTPAPAGAPGAPSYSETESLEDTTIDNFLEQLDAEQITPTSEVTTAVSIAFTSKDAGKAAAIANAIADAYVEDSLNTKFEAAKKTAHWLSARLRELGLQVAAANETVQKFRVANNLTEIPQSTAPNNATQPNSILDQQVAGISAQIVTAKADLAEKEATYQRVMQLADSGHAEDVSAVVTSPLIASLRTQETELLRQEADLSSRYGPRHPKMMDLESQKKNLEAKIKEEVNRVVETTKSDVMVARAHVASLEASLGNTSSQSRAQGGAMAKLASLQANAQTALTLYQTVLSRYQDVQSQSGFQVPDTRVLSRGVVPDDPSSPKKAKDTAVGIAAGLFLGLVLAFAVENLDIGFRTTAQIERRFGLPVLATVLELKTAKRFRRDPSEQVLEQPTSAFTESIRGIDLGLRLARGDSSPRTVIVTSAVPAEGKTTVAASLARLAAEKGQRVLLIDADLRKPGVAKAIGLKDVDKGIVEALSDVESWHKCLVSDPKSRLMILPCLHHAANAAELLGSPAMQQLMKKARTAFDLVVLDTAPLLPVHDSWVIASLSDATVLVARWEKTPREAVSRAIQILHEVEAPVSGIVMMRANSQQFQYYNYGYQDYREYNKYYSS